MSQVMIPVKLELETRSDPELVLDRQRSTFRSISNLSMRFSGYLLRKSDPKKNHGCNRNEISRNLLNVAADELEVDVNSCQLNSSKSLKKQTWTPSFWREIQTEFCNEEKMHCQP